MNAYDQLTAALDRALEKSRQVASSEDVRFWEREAARIREERSWLHQCGGRIVAIDPDGHGPLYHCSKCGSADV